MTLTWTFYIGLSALAIWTQQVLLRHHPLRWRILHFSIALGLLLALLPIFLGMEKESRIPSKDHQLGFLLWDRSASVEALEAQRQEWKERIRSGELGQVEWMEFSEGLLPPHGDALAGESTDLGHALRAIETEALTRAPDWIWVHSDFGTLPAEQLDTALKNTRLYATLLEPESQRPPDVALNQLHTDPVWYARTPAPVRVSLSRNTTELSNTVDLLFRLDGQLVSTQAATFEEGALEANIEVELQAQHIGPSNIEVQIAEGQGGGEKLNDHLIYRTEVLRDRVRILRVVGRPNWSSKFLRDQLVQREDVDLVDFHILRSMNDSVMAPPSELALIPFPVEELFVENIDSFDFIIWQNFNHASYPFFRPEYLRNISEVVRAGTGLLLWGGTLPWSLEEAPLRELAPIRNRGEEHLLAQGSWRVNSAEFLMPKGFGIKLEAEAEKTLRVFPGQLNDDARIALHLGEQPVVALKTWGEGRVVQILSDQLWKWSFNGNFGQEGHYDELLQRILLWLQHHPDAEGRDFSLPNLVRGNRKIHVELIEPLQQNTRMIWTGSEGERELIHDLEAGPLSYEVLSPKQPGSYTVTIEGLAGTASVGVKGLQREFWPKKEIESGLPQWQKLGFEFLEDGETPALRHSTTKGELLRKTGEPWYREPWYLGGLVLLLCLHWLIINRVLTWHPHSK